MPRPTGAPSRSAQGDPRDPPARGPSEGSPYGYGKRPHPPTPSNSAGSLLSIHGALVDLDGEYLASTWRILGEYLENTWRILGWASMVFFLLSPKIDKLKSTPQLLSYNLAANRETVLLFIFY